MKYCCTIRKGASVALWTTATVLMCLGLVESQDPLDFYAWGCFLTLVAAALTATVFIDHTSLKAQREVTAAIAEAVGEEMAHYRQDASVHQLR